MQRYSQEEKDFLMAYIPGHSYRDIAEAFSERFRPVTVEQIHAFCRNHHIPTGRLGYFPKGHVPANKGKKTPVGKQSVATQFKPGNQPFNWRPVGSERVNIYGYVEVKVSEPKTWRLKHRVVWETHNGPLPDGWIVIFKDGDKQNLDPDNLDAIPQALNARLNQLGLSKHTKENYETAKTIALISSERGRKRRNEKDRAGNKPLQPDHRQGDRGNEKCVHGSQR